MKQPHQSWREYLQHGVSLMEGTSQEARRQLTDAKKIFEDCAQQEEDLDVKVEAFYRYAQCAYYQVRSTEAKRWAESGDEHLKRLQAKLSTNTPAQCLLLRGVLYQGFRDYGEALGSMRLAWELDPPSIKLKGDIANRLGRLYWEDGKHFTSAEETMQEARNWLMRAVEAVRLYP